MLGEYRVFEMAAIHASLFSHLEEPDLTLKNYEEIISSLRESATKMLGQYLRRSGSMLPEVIYQRLEAWIPAISQTRVSKTRHDSLFYSSLVESSDFFLGYMG
jgi:hypothetical protein